MAKCTKAKELIITTEDKAGMLSEVASAIAAQKVNITAICAYAMEGKAVFTLVTTDNQKAKSVAQSKGWKAEDSEVVIVELPDKVGAVKEISQKLKEKNISLKYCYGTTCTQCAPDCTCRLVLKADNNDAIISALK